MPHRSIRDEQQGVVRNRVSPSDPAQVRAALAGNSSSSSPAPALNAGPSTVTRADRPAVRGQSKVNINQGNRVRGAMDDNIDKMLKGD
jgi:hypothetical protein